MKRPLITGGAGFIGSHLVRGFNDLAVRPIVLDSLRTGRRENLEGLVCDFFEGDVRHPEDVQKAARGCDVIFHLAAMVSVPESLDDPDLCRAINVSGTKHVIEAARAEQVRVVLASTCAVYGAVLRPTHRESDTPEPLSPYAESKLAAEQMLAAASLEHGLSGVALRFFNVFGPRQDPQSGYAAAVASFCERARRGKPLEVHGDGAQVRDFVHVADVVAALLLAGERGEGVYNVASGEGVTINRLAELIVELSGRNSPIRHTAARAGDVRYSCGDAGRIRSLGWSPRIALREGLAETLSNG